MTSASRDTGTAPRRVHFIGIGGTAMVAGARLALEAGWEVRGSDDPLYPPTSDMVRALGVEVATGYAPANLDWDPGCVVIGNALSRGNPEVETVLDRRMTYMSLPEWLKENVLRQRRPIVVCGTHGKTTTTALATYLLDRCGLEAGYLVGGQPVDFPHSARLGPAGAPFVIEGDEYDTAFFDKRAKFFHYLPEIAVVTSLEFDHGDIYPSLAEIERAFQLMLRQVPRSGCFVACADNAAAGLVDRAFSRTMTYGFSESAAFRGVPRGHEGGLERMEVFEGRASLGEFGVPVTGRHNLANALAALAIARQLGAGANALREALAVFRGVRRRMEVFLERDGVRFIDDFAHHPTAIHETVVAARRRWPGARLWAVFEPRSNTTVTRRFQDALEEAFAAADIVRIGPIYREERIEPADRLDRGRLAAALRRRGADASCADDIDALADEIRRTAVTGDVVLFLSNGAFGGIYDRIRAPG